VTARGAGTATITATVEGRSGSARIEVRAAAVPTAPPPSAPPPTTTPAPPAPEVAIGDLVLAYAAALQSKNVSRAKSLYPEMPSQQERELREALGEMEDLRVRLAATNVRVTGDQATAVVTGQWTFRGGRPLNVSNTYEFERRSDTWRIVAIH
jgi:hypothetical protein